MKVSVNWLKEFAKVDLPINELVTKIGTQLGAIEETLDLSAKYNGAIVAKVVSCQDHPNADKLHVCMVDDNGAVKDVSRNENGFVQVVCGANNVAEGQTIIWLPPGVVVPETFGSKEPFKLAAKELRGVLSQGMIASSRELDFGDDHDGIIVLDQDAKPGTPITEVFCLNDYIIDIENKMFTHRPDCFGILGVAREVAGIQNIGFTSPDWYIDSLSDSINKAEDKLILEVKNEIPELAPRFIAVAMSGVEIVKSPLWLQTYLARLGVKPINNVVDITNFMMLLTGQPLHAYDYDKVANANSDGRARLVVRKPNDGEDLILLGNKKIRLDAKVVSAVIATDKMAIGLGGIMGGADTEVDDKTKNIILECANFDMFAIRKTAMKYGIFTDAFTRFSKNQSKWQNDRVIAKTAQMLNEQAKAVIAGDFIDTPAIKETENSVIVTASFINDRLGLKLSLDEISKLLTNVEIKTTYDQDNLIVTVPFWRTDIEIPEDIVEEIGRLYGYDKLPIELPVRTLKLAKRDITFTLKSQIRQVMAAAGANELLTYSFVHGNLIDKVGQNKELAFQLSNALSPDLQYYRMSILPSILEKIHPNIKAGYNQFGLFEIGKVHIKNWLDEEKLPKEEQRLAFVFALNNKIINEYSGAPYYQAKYYLVDLLDKLDIRPRFIELPQKPEQVVIEQLSVPFEYKRSAAVLDSKNDKFLGVIGEFRADVKTALKLPDYIAGFEIDIDKLISNDSRTSNYIPLSKFPKVEQDISLKVPENVQYYQLEHLINKQLTELKANDTNFEVLPLDIYQPNGANYKHFAFRITIISQEKTLKSKDVNDLLNQVAEKAKNELGASRL